MTIEFEKALEILNILKDHGEAYICGGAVRDYILNIEADDIDICTNVSMETLEKLFNTHDIGQNKDFGIVVVNYEGFLFEIAQFRRDGQYSDNRRPDSVEIVKSVKDDVARRDFTINGMLMDSNLNVIDYVGGKDDLERKELRTIGDAELRFDEDYLRMLRAVRFATRFKFNLDIKTKHAIRKHAHKIVNVSQERIFKEIWKMAHHGGFAESIEMLQYVDLLRYVLPEIHVMIDVKQNPKWHPEGDVFEHTICALKSLRSFQPGINFAILFHDVGKPKTTKLHKGKIVAYGHDEVGAKMIIDIAHRMTWSNELRDKVAFCVRNHMKLHHFNEMRNSKVKALTEHKYWPILKKVGYADVYSSGRDDMNVNWKIVTDKEALVKKSLSLQTLRQLINGKYVMKICPNIEGPVIGRKIQKTISWIVDNKVHLSERKRINNFIKGIN